MRSNVINLAQGGGRKRVSGLLPHAPENLAFAQKIDDLLHFKQYGHCLSECYGDENGSDWWSAFVSPVIQKPLKGTRYEYYAISDEMKAIRACRGVISQIVLNDRDIDAHNLIVIEKGNGSRNAMLNKTLVQLDAFADAGIKTRLYVTREHSPTYREQAKRLFAEYRPGIVCLAQDVDYNREDPSIVPDGLQDRENLHGLNYEAPRVIFEFGTSRSNIATNCPDIVPYEELYKTFAHDRKVCRDGGILIMASDCNQNKITMEGSFSHPAHGEFSKNILRRAAKEGILSVDFDPSLIGYSPRWDERRHLLKHTLYTKQNQSFGVYRDGKGFVDVNMNVEDEYLYSHSFRWPEKVILDAACSNGFKPMGTFWAAKRRVAVFMFKAI